MVVNVPSVRRHIRCGTDRCLIEKWKMNKGPPKHPFIFTAPTNNVLVTYGALHLHVLYCIVLYCDAATVPLKCVSSHTADLIRAWQRLRSVTLTKWSYIRAHQYRRAVAVAAESGIGCTATALNCSDTGTYWGTLPLRPFDSSTHVGRESTRFHCFGSCTGYASRSESSSGYVFWHTAVCAALHRHSVSDGVT